MLYYVDTAPGAWGHPNGVQSIVVDTGVGQCFEAHWADLNNDGVLEIMASCYDTRSEQLPKIEDIETLKNVQEGK